MIRRLAASALAAFILALGLLLATAGLAQSAPNNETVLPAEGVTSIERLGLNAWVATFSGQPSEVKIMDPRNEVLCGTNYGRPCPTSLTFGSSGNCVYLQVDGIPGQNSSDPYVCRTFNVPTSTPTSTEVSTSSPSPSATLTPEPTETPTSTSSPSPLPPTEPEPSSPPTETSEPTPTTSPTPTGTPSPSPKSTDGFEIGDPPRAPKPKPTASATEEPPIDFTKFSDDS